MDEVHHYILFKTTEAYDAAVAVLNQPITEDVPGSGGHIRRPKTYDLILAGTVGHHNGKGGRHALWAIERTTLDTEMWELVKAALAPLNPYYTDDGVEVTEFLGWA